MPSTLESPSPAWSGVLDRFLTGNRVARELVRRASRHDVNRLVSYPARATMY